MQGSLNQEISPTSPNIQNSLPPSHYNLMMNVGACQAGVRSRCWCLVVAGPLTLPPTTQTRFLMEPSRGAVYPQPPHRSHGYYLCCSTHNWPGLIRFNIFWRQPWTQDRTLLSILNWDSIWVIRWSNAPKLYASGCMIESLVHSP